MYLINIIISKQCDDGDDDDDLVTRETKEGERKVFQRAPCPDPPTADRLVSKSHLIVIITMQT